MQKDTDVGGTKGMALTPAKRGRASSGRICWVEKSLFLTKTRTAFRAAVEHPDSGTSPGTVGESQMVDRQK
jgi:hypothetical protein